MRNSGKRRVDAVDDEFVERAAQAHQRLGAGAAVHDQLADQRIVVRRDRIALIDAPNRRARRRRPADDNRRCGPGEGRKVDGMLGVDAAFDGVAAKRMSSCVSDSGEPAAMRICSLTRSTPVIISVTGCSTWMRVFISMK